MASEIMFRNLRTLASMLSLFLARNSLLLEKLEYG